MRLGELGAAGTAAWERITRASGLWIVSWSCVSRRRWTKASYIVRVEAALDCSARSFTRTRFWLEACLSAAASEPCSDDAFARATATSLPMEPASRFDLGRDLGVRGSRFWVSTAPSWDGADT